MQSEIYWLWLMSIKGLGPVKLNALLKEWSDGTDIYYETEEKIYAFMEEQKIFSKNDFSELCRSKQNIEKCQKELELLRKEGIEIISINSKEYPEKLREVIDAPPVFFAKGKWKNEKINHGLLVAVVGTRRVTRYGKEIAAAIGKLSAEYGVTLVSGMARGVDGVAHRACLKHGGYSVGVLASGLGSQFPASNRDLYLDMEQEGVLITEEWYQTPPLANLFPKRNRIISGLADGVIVVEAAEKSGSLITADYALEQGKDIYAVPGRIGDVVSVGCNRLINQGAYILEDVEKFFVNLTGKTDGQKRKVKNFAESMEENEKIVYHHMSTEPIYIGRLLERTGLEQGELQLCLLQMEWKGYIEQISPGYYTLNFLAIT